MRGLLDTDPQIQRYFQGRHHRDSAVLRWINCDEIWAAFHPIPAGRRPVIHDPNAYLKSVGAPNGVIALKAALALAEANVAQSNPR